ncbi:MAG: Hsp20/alpha crystallin family protein [Pseudomonadota bacterium]
MAKESKEVAVSKGTVERMPRPLTLFSDIDRMFDEFFNRRWMRPFAWPRPFAEIAEAPSVDVIDREQDVLVRIAVPGYRKEDIEVSVSNGMLTIKGETKSEKKEEKGEYYACEILHGAFSRTIALPAEVQDEKASATLKDGILELVFPKVEKSKRRTITIS